MEDVKKQIRGVLSKVFEVFQVEMPEGFLEEFSIEVAVAPEETGADFASNVAMQLARTLHKAPREVAEKIIEEMEKAGAVSRRRASEVSGAEFEVEVAGAGFLNFYAKDEYFRRKIEDFRVDFDKNISRDEYFKKKVVCEFSDPNPFKVLHVGHLYTSIVGDAISKLVEFAGGEVVRANFGGDVGLHVAKTIFAVRDVSEDELSEGAREVLKNVRDEGELKEISAERTANFLAECYVLGTRAYEEDENAKLEITRLNKLIFEISGEMQGVEAQGATNLGFSEEEKNEVRRIYIWGREASYKYFDEFYARVGVKFDKYYPESTVAERGVEEVRAQIGKVYEESDGAVIFPGEKYDLHTRVFINKEGLPTYETKDVGLIFTKWDDYRFDKSIVITGNEQSEYMKVVLKSVEQYAPELVERTEHITHGMVRLPGNAKMSSRLGNFIRAVDVLDEVEEMVSDEKIALAAIKYAFLKYKIGGNIEFDAKESVSMTGNSGVYLLYSTVRARKVLLAASSGAPASLNNIAARTFPLSGYERKLIRKTLEYKDVLCEAVGELAPHKLANYLYELAQEFSRFYEHVKVAGSEDEAERRGIVEAYNKVMTSGLGLLGIEIPEEM